MDVHSFTDNPLRLRVLSSVHAPQIEVLLNRCFPVREGASFYDDFPVWNPLFGVPVRRFGAVSVDGQVHACALARVAELKRPSGGLVRVGIIGGVATASLARGQGLAAKLTQQASEWLAGEKASAIVLWGSGHQFYAPLGFFPSGKQWRISINELTLDEPCALRIEREWNVSLLPWLRKRVSGLALGPADAKWVSAHQNIQWRWLQDEAGGARAFIAVGKGIDLPGIVHEYAGQASDVRSLLYAVREEGIASEILGTAQDLHALRIEPVAGASVSEEIALLRVLDEEVWDPAALWFWGIDGA